MRKILLYGEAAKRFGREHYFAVGSAAEAIQALSVNFAGFKSFMKDAHKYGIGFKVYVGNKSLRKEDDASLPSPEKETISIIPAIFGSGGWTRILLGAALIVGGILISGASFGAATPIGGAMFSVGVSLVLGGVYELLASPPKPGSTQGLDENGQSFVFSGPENVTRQGGGIPIGYGRMMVGSTVISAGIEDEDR